MRFEAVGPGARKAAVAALQAACRRLGPDVLARVLLGGTTEPDRRVVLARLLNRESLVVELDCDGTRWSVPTGDEIFTELFLSGNYQLDDVVAVDRWVGTHLGRAGHDAVIDVGANIGTTTCPLAGAGRRVLAIEPMPDTFAVLRRNIELQGLGHQVTAVNCAIAEATGRVEMIATAGSGSSEIVLDGHAPSFEQWGMRSRATVTVAAAPLDDVVSQAGIEPAEVRFVWSDTQGFEGDVVTSGARLWAEGVPLYLEVWPRALDRRYTLDGFADRVASSFSSFLPREELGRRSPAVRPIGDLLSFMRGVPRWTDALLVP